MLWHMLRMLFSGSPAPTLKTECTSIVEQNYGQWWQSLRRTLLHGVLGRNFQLLAILVNRMDGCAFAYVGNIVYYVFWTISGA